MAGVNLAGLWVRDSRGYLAHYVDAATRLGNIYRITSAPYGKTRKVWTLHVNDKRVAFTSHGTSLRLADVKRRAQEIEDGADWRAEGEA